MLDVVLGQFLLFALFNRQRLEASSAVVVTAAEDVDHSRQQTVHLRGTHTYT